MRPASRTTEATRSYAPNKYSFAELCFCVLTGVGLLIYGTHGFMVGKLFLPGSFGRAMQLEGFLPTLLFLFASISWALGLLSVVVDHFDERDNEAAYERFGSTLHRVAIAFLVASVLFGALSARFS